MKTRFTGFYCTKCKTLCHTYEQGLCCACGQPWETERQEEEDYPKEWVYCAVTVEPFSK